MYRFLFRPKWIMFHVAVAGVVFLMMWAATWQWSKHVKRDAFVAMVHERQDDDRAPTELAPALNTESPADIEYLHVTATGSYLTTGQLTEINRTQDGVNGVNVLTPFQIDGGPIVIVNRGFVADGLDVPAPPVGTLLVGGTARTSEVRRTGELTDNSDGATTEVRRIDLPLIAKLVGLDVAPVYIDFIASKPASDPPPIPVPKPDLSGGPPHVSYTVQWCIFSICAIVGWVFAIRRSLRSRRRGGAKDGDAPDPPPIVIDEVVSVDGRGQPSA